MKKIIGNIEYEILATIAEGGMGTVFKALQKGASGFEKIVAIKKLLDCYSKDKRFIIRFIDEAKLVANLIHENIVQIYQLDKYMNEYYFVQEYVNGINLHDFMEFHRMSKTRLPVKLAVFIAANVARALAYAHSRHGSDGKPLNIIHCDVCSYNILISREGVVKLTDFGVARAVTVREPIAFSGKLPFMSPEQVNKAALDFHSDIYSLGIVLFYMLSGGRVCRHLNVKPHEIVSQAQKNYIDWSLLPGDLDKTLLGILNRMLATKPEDRYRCTTKVVKKLEQYISRSGYSVSALNLAKYMRRQMPACFGEKQYTGNNETTDEENVLATVKMPIDHSLLETRKNSDKLAKTRPMSKEELSKSALFQGRYI
jgi:serine/threonine protein kinase